MPAMTYISPRRNQT